MDELSVWKGRVLILEKQMEKVNAQLEEFIKAFEEFRRHSRPFIPLPEDQEWEAYFASPNTFQEEEKGECSNM